MAKKFILKKKIKPLARHEGEAGIKVRNLEKKYSVEITTDVYKGKPKAYFIRKVGNKSFHSKDYRNIIELEKVLRTMYDKKHKVSRLDVKES